MNLVYRIQILQQKLHQSTKMKPNNLKSHTFLTSQIHLEKFKKRSQRYSNQIKDLSIKVNHHSPRCYSELHEIFHLKSLRTTLRTLATLRRHLMVCVRTFSVSLHIKSNRLNWHHALHQPSQITNVTLICKSKDYVLKANK